MCLFAGTVGAGAEVAGQPLQSCIVCVWGRKQHNPVPHIWERLAQGWRDGPTGKAVLSYLVTCVQLLEPMCKVERPNQPLKAVFQPPHTCRGTYIHT